MIRGLVERRDVGGAGARDCRERVVELLGRCVLCRHITALLRVVIGFFSRMARFLFDRVEFFVCRNLG